MKPPGFAYYDPTTVAEAVALLQEHGPDAKILAGGQSLVPLLNMRLTHPAVLVDINRIPELSEIRQEGNKLVLGATVRHYQLEEDPLIRQTVPLLAEVAPYIGHAQIRHRGTVCGSLVHADPAAELPAAMLALDAELVAEGPGGRRTIPFREFYLGYLMTTLAPDELVVAVRVPIPAPGTGWGFQEISRRHGDFAIAGAAVLVALHLDGSVSQACIALTGVSGAALRAAEVEAALAGKLPTPEVLAEVSSQVADLVDAETDLHATLEYRRQVAAVVTERALAMAVKRAQGGQPK